MNEVTDCQICFSPYDSNERMPMLSSCNHTICKQCLLKLKNNLTFNCPLCMTSNALRDAKPNYSLRDTLEVMQGLQQKLDETKRLQEIQEAQTKKLLLQQVFITDTVFVKHIGDGVDKGYLEYLFSDKGKVEIVSINLVNTPPKAKANDGFAFIKFKDKEDAKRAVEKHNSSIVLGQHISVTIAHAKTNVQPTVTTTNARHFQNNSDSDPIGPITRGPSPPHFNYKALHLAGIPSNFDFEYLWFTCEKFGKVIDKKIFLKRGKTYCFGMVEFRNDDDAKNAKEGLTKFFESKNLTVKIDFYKNAPTTAT